MKSLSMNVGVGIVLLAAATDVLGASTQPPLLPASPITETRFGVQVTDRWRGMEAMDPLTTAWMTAEGAYTRRVLDSIEPRTRLLKEIAAASSSVAQLWNIQVQGGRTFWMEQAGTSPSAKLMVRDPAVGSRTLLDPASIGPSAAITYYLASPMGDRVALGVASNGDEATRLFVYDALAGLLVAGPIDRTDLGGLSWSDDGKALFIQRLQNTTDQKARFLNLTAQVWDLKSEPRTVLGGGHSAIAAGGTRRPRIFIVPGSAAAIATVRNGVGADLELWTAPATRADEADAPWKQLTVESDGVTAFSARGGDLYFLSHKNSPTFQVLHAAVGQPFSQADVLVAADPNRVITKIQAASDGLWVLTRKGLYSELLFVPKDGVARPVALPTAGSVGELFADPSRPGVTIELGNWTASDAVYSSSGFESPFRDLHLAQKTTYDPSQFVAVEMQATAKDGTRIPMTLISRRGGPSGPRVVRMEGYGSYGAALTPAFDPRGVVLMDAGADRAICHVRGGGELGEAWRLAGKDAQKPNTWRDFIACGETLVARGITSPDKLVVVSASAGGIMVGRAMEEAPHLFAGVIDSAPAANMLRAETMPGGPANIKEFGSTATEAGFSNLLAMDSVAHVQDGVTYPAVMIITNLNDPRVQPWQGGKFAAALVASGTNKPVLLRVESEGGHDTGATKAQDDNLEADADAFVFWSAGQPGWVPKAVSNPTNATPSP